MSFASTKQSDSSAVSFQERNKDGLPIGDFLFGLGGARLNCRATSPYPILRKCPRPWESGTFTGRKRQRGNLPTASKSSFNVVTFEWKYDKLLLHYMLIPGLCTGLRLEWDCSPKNQTVPPKGVLRRSATASALAFYQSLAYGLGFWTCNEACDPTHRREFSTTLRGPWASMSRCFK